MASFSLLVNDILVKEIWPRLDVTSKVMWREVEKYVACLFPVPRPSLVLDRDFSITSVNWRTQETKSFALLYEQALYDGHLGRIERLWPYMRKWLLWEF